MGGHLGWQRWRCSWHADQPGSADAAAAARPAPDRRPLAAALAAAAGRQPERNFVLSALGLVPERLYLDPQTYFFEHLLLPPELRQL